MKRLLVILVLAAIYAIPASSTTTKSLDFENSTITVISETDDNSLILEEKEKEKEKDKDKDKKKKTVKKASSCCSGKEAVKTSCSEAQKKSCAASKVSCSETKKEDKK